MDIQGGKFLSFILEDEIYGIPIQKVKEIIGIMEITHIPKTKIYLKGVINLRGKIVPIMDLRLKFGMEPKPYTDRTCIIIIEMNIAENIHLMGIIVDTVAEVINIQKSEIEAPNCDNQIEGEFLTGFGKFKENIIIIIDIEKIFSQAEITIINKELTDLTISQSQESTDNYILTNNHVS